MRRLPIPILPIIAGIGTDTDTDTGIGPPLILILCREISSTEATLYSDAYPGVCGLGDFVLCNVSEFILHCVTITII